ncbi:Casein kinase I -like protein hhp1 [Escovopsis weberi]|uniref:non-specific serine/threonine protein kinase n=1 Tax=Escovopsis weberi TaxID=150374 RepID=A0A0M9VSC3_ESCWE|nr:Casein kinase I -like protein hhp1 [Escovopsis weberi]
MTRAPEPVLHSLILDRYRVEGVVGRGAFGTVCLATDTRTAAKVAIKLEPPSSSDYLRREAQTLQTLHGPGIPRLRAFTRADPDPVAVNLPADAMVTDICGPSLHDLLRACGGRFGLKTTLLLANQLLARLQHVHARGFLHRDIKPGNILMGAGARGATVFLVDFGLALDMGRASGAWDKKMRMIRRRRGEGRLRRRGFCGTSCYASVAAHLEYEQTEKDDVESLAYVLIYLARGCLPWTGLPAGFPGQGPDPIAEKKLALLPEEVARDLPAEFALHLRYARSLRPDGHVDYEALRAMYKRLFESSGFQDDGVFDWTDKVETLAVSAEDSGSK